MINVYLPESIGTVHHMKVNAKNLDGALKEIKENTPDTFQLIAIEQNGICQVKPYITLFINDVMSVESNPVLTTGDRITVEVAISGG